jgi:hypothetical protein
MAAIGKLLAVLTLVVSLGLLTWSVGIYVSRPGWFDPPPDGGIDKGNKPVGFAQLKAETESLNRAAAVASEAWGVHARLLDEREKYRAVRKAAFAERLRWGHKGNPRDPVDKDNPKSPGKGFYEPVVDSVTKLYDMGLDARGLPKGRPVLGTDGNPLPGLDGLLDTLVSDVAAMKELNQQIAEGRKEYDKLSAQVGAMELRVVKMGVIRDNVQAELFFLSTFEVNVFETRETVLRRERQLRDRLRTLGINDP